MIEKISTENAAPPGGHYSQAICHGDLVYLSGILPVTKDDSHCDLDNFEQQTKQVLTNADAILEAAGSNRDNVIKATVYVADISQWPAFNQIYADFFGEHCPARCVVPVPELHHGFAVEIEIIAAKPK
jgi:2-iminobutanoate/2-iminopropanoate deaminase